MYMLPGINKISRDDGSGTWIGSMAGVANIMSEQGLLTYPHLGRNYTSPLISLFTNATLMFT